MFVGSSPITSWYAGLIDSAGYSGWQNDIPLADLHCVSVGMLLESGTESITLAQNTSPDQYGDIMVIPKCAIKEIIELRSKCRISID